MAQKAIREYQAKKLVYHYVKRYWPDFSQDYAGSIIDTSKIQGAGKISRILPKYSSTYVVKPDELFGKRGKNKLVYIADSRNDAARWIVKKSLAPVTIDQNGKKTTGFLRNFIVEPYVKHKEEYYVAIKTQRSSDRIYFSNKGGIDVEENWKGIINLEIPFEYKRTKSIKNYFEKIEAALKEDPQKDSILSFISALYQTFCLLNFTYLEINPFVFDNGNISILDLVARLDDTASYVNQNLWNVAGIVDFPNPFGSVPTKSERNIALLDSKSGASLKYKLINKTGRIWLLTSGGGGSVVFADTIGDLGYHQEIANYSDYSGNPNSDETQEFCNYIFEDMFSSNTKGKILIIGGGIANFTDIAKTFIGIEEAIKRNAELFRREKVKIFIRRGGPNYKQALDHMRTLGIELQIPISVFGPETYKTEIVTLALKSI